MNSLHIFRRDLRIHDNTSLTALCEMMKQISERNTSKAQALFIITPEQWLKHDMALVQVDLILRTLLVLADILYRQLGIQLTVLLAKDFAESVSVISQFCQDNSITQVFANHEYELNEIQRDEQLQTILSVHNISFNLYHDQCILPPNSVQNNDGQMYRVFTPFYKKWLKQLEINPPTAHSFPTNPFSVFRVGDLTNDSDKAHQQNLSDIKTLCTQVLSEYKLAWQNKVASSNNFSDKQIEQLITASDGEFIAGEVSACHKLDQFIAEDIHHYDVSRDMPALQATSKISPYLAIGSISPRLCFQQAMKALPTSEKKDDVLRWISELAWRDFYRHVLVTRPDLIKHHAYLIDTDKQVNWSYDKKAFVKWCIGQTGVPLVDSAMRCLNATGFMHNRLRMVVAMFLTKDLLIDWRWGEQYFMQMLIDGDFASNNGGWQWSASTGTDAAPYFRIMNPFSQGKTHDPEAIFIKTWIPELKNVPAKILHDEKKLIQFLSGNLLVAYPQPMVDHKQARLRAIEAFKG